MRAFFIKSFLFVVIFLGYSFGITALNLYMIRNEKIHLNKRNVIIGDSHLQTSANPNQLHGYQNICQSGEPYLITYVKLKAALKTNQIDTLLIGLSHHNISKNEDNLLKNNGSSLQIFNRCYPLLLNSDFLNNNQYNQSTFKISLLRNLTCYPKLKHLKSLGGFNKRMRTLAPKESKLKLTIKNHFKDDNGQDSFLSSTNIQYLDSIVFLANEHRIKLILISTPVHADYLASTPSIFKDEFRKLKSKYTNLGLTILDMTELYSLPSQSNYFTDYDHLNINGSVDFTSQLKKELQAIKSNPYLP